MIKDKIISKPNKLFEFLDDEQAVHLLLELGLINEFSISHPPGKTTVQAITGDLPTHYIIATRCAGNLEAEENGYWKGLDARRLRVLSVGKHCHQVDNLHLRISLRVIQSRSSGTNFKRSSFF